ncbi:MAG: hypothetical protein ACO20O_09510, partial [Pseudomonadales bacterium]
ANARYFLHLTDAQFGDLTPRQYYLLLDRQHSQIEHRKMLAGLIAATVATSWAKPNIGVSMPSCSHRGDHSLLMMNLREKADYAIKGRHGQSKPLAL